MSNMNEPRGPDQAGAQVDPKFGSSHRTTTDDSSQDAKQQARQEAREAAEKVKQASYQAAEKIKHESAKFADQVRHSAQRLAEKEKKRAAEKLDDVGQALNKAAGKLDSEDDDNLADYARSAADAVQNLAGTMRGKDLDELRSDLEDVARKRPEAFLGIAFAGGLALGRFLGSSKPETSHSAPDGSRRAYRARAAADAPAPEDMAPAAAQARPDLAAKPIGPNTVGRSEPEPSKPEPSDIRNRTGE
ncbi:MAG: hypothetical protein ACOCZE_08925 [Planctomycetota bacterium]